MELHWPWKFQTLHVSVGGLVACGCFVVGAAVGAFVVGACVAGGFVVGGAVDLLVGVAVGLVVGAAVGGFVVGAGVAGGLVVGAGVAGGAVVGAGVSFLPWYLSRQPQIVVPQKQTPCAPVLQNVASPYFDLQSFTTLHCPAKEDKTHWPGGLVGVGFGLVGAGVAGFGLVGAGVGPGGGGGGGVPVPVL